MPTVNLHGGPLDGTTTVAGEPWPRSRLRLMSGSTLVFYNVRAASDTDADYVEPQDAPGNDPFAGISQGPPGDPGPPGAKGDTGPKGDAGTPGGYPIFGGVYTNTATYSPNTTVVYNGSSYYLPGSLSAGPPAGTTPGTPTAVNSPWTLLAAKGDTGATGAKGDQGFAWNDRGAYSTTATYAAGDSVTYAGSMFIATGAIAAGAALPPMNASWRLYVSKGDTGATGAKGDTGAAGAAGANGTNGTNGTNGVGLNPPVPYNAVTAYGPLDHVAYQGSSYFIPAGTAGPAAGTAPGTPTAPVAPWVLFTAKGDVGPAGPTGVAPSISYFTVRTPSPSGSGIAIPRDSGYVLQKVVGLATKISDPDNQFDTSMSTFTCTKAGVWMFFGFMLMTSAASASPPVVDIGFRKNGVVSTGGIDGAGVRLGYGSSAWGAQPMATTILNLAVGDTVELAANSPNSSSNTAHFSFGGALMGGKGDKGDTGATGAAGAPGAGNVTNRGQWVSGTSYALHDLVRDGAVSYLCISPVSGSTAPASDATHWFVIGGGSSGGGGGGTGNTISGSGAPSSSLGQSGDYYIDLASRPLALYGPKASGAWGTARPLNPTSTVILNDLFTTGPVANYVADQGTSKTSLVVASGGGVTTPAGENVDHSLHHTTASFTTGKVLMKWKKGSGDQIIYAMLKYIDDNNFIMAQFYGAASSTAYTFYQRVAGNYSTLSSNPGVGTAPVAGDIMIVTMELLAGGSCTCKTYKNSDPRTGGLPVATGTGTPGGSLATAPGTPGFRLNNLGATTPAVIQELTLATKDATVVFPGEF